MPGYAVLAHPWWWSLVFVLVIGHVTNICVTLYLHRSATHGGVKFHPAVEHAMRFWLWLTTGMVTREWVAVHRKHHAFSDREGDPHSPAIEGVWAIVLGGVFFYRRAAADAELLEKYGKGCPDDWVERHLYARHSFAGLLGLAVVCVFLFGAGLGLLVWSGVAVWVPMVGNVINGLGHALGYRNFATKDESRNIHPFGFWIVGEELHNNHHADPRSARFRARWWEFDIGWIYIRLLAALRLADVIYARALSAGEFAARYYRKGVAEPVAESWNRAADGLERARIRVSEGIEQACDEARAELGQLRGRLEHARSEALADLEQVKARVGQARTQARTVLDEARAGVARTGLEVQGPERAGAG